MLYNIQRRLSIEAKAGLSYTFGNLLVNGIAFLTMPLFTRLLSQREYGTISIYATYVNIMLVIIGLNLNAAVVRASLDYKSDFEDFLASNLLLSSFSFAIISFIILVFIVPISHLTNLSTIVWLLILLQSYSTFIINYNSARCVALYKYKEQITISLANVIVGTILSSILVLILHNNKYLGKIAGGLAPMIIFAIMLFSRFMKRRTKKLSTKHWKYALKLSIPIMPHMLAHLILGQSDRILIQSYIGKSAAGMYSLAYNIGLILQIIITSINNAWVPWFFKRLDDKDETSILKKSKDLFALVVFLSLGLIFISPELLKIVAPISYSSAGGVIPIIVLSYVFQFMYTLLVNVQFYEKKNYYVPIGTSIAAGLNIVLNIHFIPIYGYEVAAYTTLASYFVLFLVHYAVNKRMLKSSLFSFSYFLVYLMPAAVGVVLFFIISKLIAVRYAFIVLMCVGMFIKYRHHIAEFVKNE